MTKQPSTTSLAYPCFLITLCAFFLFYKYILQIYPSIMTDELMNDFNLTGESLGFLAATFYYAYMIAQLFVGILLDKFSTRWLTAGAILCCGVGVMVFAKTIDLYTAGSARVLMGIGVAFATISYMKVASVWFPPKHYAFVSGLLATAAMAGAVFGEAPLALLLTHYGWRQVLFVTGMVGIVLAAIFAITARDNNPAANHGVKSKKQITLADLLGILTNPTNWLLMLYSGLAFSPVVVLGGLWGNPFIEQAYGLTKTQTAGMMSLMFIGLGLGSPFFGYLSDRLGVRRNIMLAGTGMSLIAILFVLYCPSMPLFFLASLLFLFGFGIGSFMIAFTLGKEANKLYLTATVVAMINSCDAFLDAVTEPLIGKFLDLTWDGKVVNGVPYFSLTNYHTALAILPIYLLLACGLLFWVKDTRVQS